ncbi:hypothetical protein [Planomicrobium sp. CPCC 101079]|nr:hypothetical protein [Planomicrobium sp. CPCC 101079]
MNWLNEMRGRLNQWLRNRRKIKYRPDQSNLYMYYNGQQIRLNKRKK